MKCRETQCLKDEIEEHLEKGRINLEENLELRDELLQIKTEKKDDHTLIVKISELEVEIDTLNLLQSENLELKQQI